MRLTKNSRRALSLVALLLAPVCWRITVTDWDAEIFGAYTTGRTILNLIVTASAISVVYILYGKKDARYKVLSVLTAFAATGLCVLLVEIPVWLFGLDYHTLFGSSEPKDELHLSSRVNKPDPVLIHIHWPDSSFSGEVVGNLVQLGIPRPHRYEVDIQYDRNGFRNDRDYLKADVAVIGDSFVEAAIVPLDESLVKRIERRLNVPAVNLGQIAYGFRQELEVLKRYALPLSPKLILWVVFGGNDLRDVKAYEDALRNFGKPKEARPWGERLFTRNLLVSVSTLMVNTFRFWPGETAYNRSGSFVRSDGTEERVYFGQTINPWTDHDWNVATDTLKTAKTLSEEHGAEFVVVYVPRKYVIYKGRIKVEPGTDIAEWEIAPLAETLAKWCSRNHLHFVDTTPRLASAVAQGIHPYFIDDVHWNPLGHEMAADTIIEYLHHAGWVPFDSQVTRTEPPQSGKEAQSR